MFFVPAVVTSGEEGCGDTPIVRVDSLTVGLDIGRDRRRCSRPEPNLDPIILAAREGIESTSNVIEFFAIGIWAGSLGPTTLVGVEVGVTVCRGGRSVGTPVSNQRS